jgi:hypothetical protein
MSSRPPIRRAWFTPESMRGVVLLVVAAVAAAAAAPLFLALHAPARLTPGPGLARTSRLSEWFSGLAGTPGDTDVYLLESEGAGGSMLVLGGTHADEPAGHVAAVILAERARVSAGRLIVIPRANASGFTHNFPQEAHPAFIDVATPSGPRRFPFGARATNSVHQWPDPQVYTLALSGQTLSGSETRNLNRAYPGRPDGTLTEQIAYAIATLVRRERVDLTVDLHEASPEYPVVNTIVAHERAMDLAAAANVALQDEGIDIGIEQSPGNLHGLSHRELGDATGTLAVLMETTNPGQGRLRGRTDAALMVTGRDRFYVLASDQHRLSVPFPPSGWPLDVRVARHLAGILALAGGLGDVLPGKRIDITGIPRYADVVSRGIGVLLAPAGGTR